MRYKIEIENNALEEIEAGYRYIVSQNAPLNARRWLLGIYKAINGLKTMPTACALARESLLLNIEVRQSVYKSHRILFTIKGNIIRIHRVVHTAQKNLTSLSSNQD